MNRIPPSSPLGPSRRPRSAAVPAAGSGGVPPPVPARISPNLGIETWDEDELAVQYDEEIDPNPPGSPSRRTLAERIVLFEKVEAGLLTQHEEVTRSAVHDANEELRERCLRNIMNDLKEVRRRLAECRLQKSGGN